MSLPSLAPDMLAAGQVHFSKFQIADKDGDLDRDPYTSTSWDGDSHSTSTGTINWVTDFGLPEKPKFVFLYVLINDLSALDGGGAIGFKAKNATTLNSFVVYSRPSDALNSENGCVAVAEDGTTYWAITASGANTCDITIRVSAWIR